MMPFRNPAPLLAGLALCGLVSGATAVEHPSLPPFLGTSERYVSDWRTGLALDGADPVAYFAEGAPRPGRETLDTVWRGLAWRFASEANRRAFIQEPGAYAPRLGGYDPAMAARGVLVAGDPTIFAVQAGRLYLFRSAANRTAFAGDPALAVQAERAWSGLRETLAQD